MNLFGNLRANLVLLAALVIAIAVPAVAAQLSGLTGDGWHSWQVDGVDDAPEMCCYSWKHGRNSGGGCDLDRRPGGFDTSRPGAAGDVRLYVRVEDGRVVDIRSLSASCPVTASTPIADLGKLPNAESVTWLSQFIEPNGRLASEAITAVAVHDGDNAARLLLETAESPGDQDNREDAIFWMAQARIGDSAPALRHFIFEDPDPDIRQHAAFAYSQSSAGDIADVLVRQGQRDAESDVRSQAWFWLAQTEAPESERAIGKAVREDADEDVREEAIFALSQLPEDRAVKALADVLEDRSLDRDTREQALFWLAQSGSDEAFRYIDNILTQK